MVSSKPNVVLITVDSLRTDFVGTYDEEVGELTPALDDFAAEGVVFENAIAQGSYTRGSIPSFFTSTYPGKLEKGSDVTDEVNLASVLSDNGYNSAFFHSNPFLSAAKGYGEGFDVFDDSLLPWNLNLSQKRVRQLGRVFRLLRKTPYLPADKLVDKASGWLREVESPFFLWVHFMDPHGPYQGPSCNYLDKYRAEKIWNKAVNRPEEVNPEEKEKLVGAYREEVRFTDENVGRLLGSIDKRDENCFTCITADHGEEFGEHGDYSHNPKCFEELIHVPLVIRAPGVTAGRRAEPVALLDIFPTVVEFAGLDPKKYDLDGQSLLRLLGGDSSSAREYVVSQPGSNEICLRSNRWKYVVKGSRELLYDLENDPNETEDKSSSEEEIVEKFRRELAGREDEFGALPEDYMEPSEEEEETRRRLEDLGYL